MQIKILGYKLPLRNNKAKSIYRKREHAVFLRALFPVKDEVKYAWFHFFSVIKVGVFKVGDTSVLVEL